MLLASPAGAWLAALSALGVAAIHMELEPVKAGIDFHPGQFGFLRMNAQGLREPHPFTIATGKRDDGRVEFVIRALGDYANKLVVEVDVMRAMAHDRGAELVAVPGGPTDPVFAERFAAICREADPAGIDVAFCGPKGLAPRIREQMRANGVPDANLRYELFEFR